MIRIMILMAAIAMAPLAAAQAHNPHKGGAVRPQGHGANGATTHDHADSHHAGHGGAVQSPTNASVKAALAAGGELIVVDVLGVVCDFCATSMNKVFSRQAEIAAIHVDLNNKTLTLATKRGRTLDDQTITNLVRKSGYRVATVRRGADAAAYKSAEAKSGAR